MDAKPAVKRARKVGAVSGLEKVLLLHLAEKLGPAIDQVDVVGSGVMTVRDLVICMVDDKVASPSEVRAALIRLEALGFASLDESLRDARSKVGLTDTGLVAARRIKPGIGKPREVVLRLIDGPSRFAAHLETGSRDLDRDCNKSGVVLACFYLLAACRPTSANPLLAEDLDLGLTALAALGIGPKFGPGDRLSTSRESVVQALKTLRGFLALQNRPPDGRKGADEWVLEGAFPAVRVVARRKKKDLGDWSHLVRLITQALNHAREAQARRAREGNA